MTETGEWKSKCVSERAAATSAACCCYVGMVVPALPFLSIFHEKPGVWNFV